ncbi:MAG: signal peptidase II [Legionellaceae bacterium]|nr:signal peptidase II [Legionellaceae bacterium]
MKKAIALGLSLLVIVLDQITKYWAMTHLMPYESVAVFPMFSWTLAFNSGSAFSFLAASGGWHMWFFTGFSSLVSIALIIWIMRLESRLFTQMLALALILGGAVGNLIDRIRLGHVIDFIDVYYKTHHWPVFNVADSAICLGAIWLALVWVREK